MLRSCYNCFLNYFYGGRVVLNCFIRLSHMKGSKVPIAPVFIYFDIIDTYDTYKAPSLMK